MGCIKLLIFSNLFNFAIPILERKEPLKRTDFVELFSTFSIMQTLNNVKLSLNFNVRQPNAKTASPIYCVVKIDTKQLKVPTGQKVNAWQWDKQRQQCSVNANMVATEQANNANANRIINAIRMAYDDLFMYLCGSGDTYTANEIEKLIRETITAKTDNDNNMSNPNAIPPKRTITATTLLKKAFATYYPEGKGKASTYFVNVGLFNAYLDYIKASAKGDTPKNFLSQTAVNEYQQTLKAEGLAATTINKRVGIVKRLINHLAGLSEGVKYGIHRVVTESVKDSRSHGENKKFSLTDKQLQAIADCNNLTDQEKQYRDLFLLQIECGQRVSDLPKVLQCMGKIEEYEGQKSLVIMTQKENIPATIFLTPFVEQMQSRYQAGEFKDVHNKYFSQHYNEKIKTVAQKAGLNESVTYMDDKAGAKVEQVRPLYELVTTHIARHTFITRKLKEGYSPDKLAYMTGHADDTMIKRIYSHLTAADKAKAATLELMRVKGATETETKNSDETANAIIAEQAKENYKQRNMITSQRQMIAIEKQRREISELLKNAEDENMKDLLTLVQMHLDHGDVEQAQEVIKDLVKYGAGVQLLDEEDETDYFDELGE